MKKNTKIAILIAAAVIVLAAAFAVTAWLCGWFQIWFGGSDGIPADVKLYYNVDRSDFVSGGLNGMSSRSKRKDGYYHIKMAADGAQLDVLTDNYYTVEVLDLADVIGLKLDENNVVQEYYELGDMGLWFLHGFVESVDGDTFNFNTSAMFDGARKQFTVEDGIPVISVSADQMFTGYKGSLKIDDAVKIVMDGDNRIQVIYTEPYVEPEQFYWNYDRCWDSTLGSSYRESNELGYYEFKLATNGDTVTVKTKSLDVVNTMDSNRIFYLTFDEDGYVTAAEKVTSGWYGDYFADNITENSCDALANTYATKYSFNFSKYCKVYDISAGQENKGSATTLQRGDKCCYFYDSRHQVYAIYVVYRASDNLKIYFNSDRQYDSVTKLSTRTPDADGWYRMKAAGNGGSVVLKTKDKRTVQTWDSFVCRAVILGKDNEIQYITVAEAAVQGGYVWGSYYTVDSVNGNKVKVTREERTDLVGELSEDCQIYDVSYYAEVRGAKSTVKVGDTVHCWTDITRKVAYVFVVKRSLDLPLAWNLNRKYDDTNKVTTRVPDASGRYVYSLAVEGECISAWTSDKEIANQVDSYNAPLFGVKLSEDNEILRTVLYTSTVYGQSGAHHVSWTDVKSIAEDGTVTVVKTNSKVASENGIEYTVKMAKDCKVYNITTACQDHRGEATTLQVGDCIQAACNKDNEATRIFIVGGRTLDLPLCWNINRKYNSTTKETTRVPDENGHYNFDIARGGELISVWTADKAVASQIDSYNAPMFALVLGNDNQVRRVISANGVVSGASGSNGMSWVDVTAVSGDSVTTVKTNSTKAEENGIVRVGKLASGYAVYNVTDAYEDHKGEKTELRVGDVIHVACNKNKEITTIYVVGGRTLELPICWNLNRQYDSTDKSTKRTPDGNGRYNFELACNGETVLAWTTDKSVADKVDSYNAPAFAAKIAESGEIKRTVTFNAVDAGKGGTNGSWVTVTDVAEDGTVYAVKIDPGNSSGKDGTEYTITKAADCKTVNTTSLYADHKGEYTDVQVGDVIHVIVNSEKKASYIFVVSREFAKATHGDHTSEMWTAWDGTADISAGGNYYLTKDITVSSAQGIKFDKSATVNLCLNGHTISGEGRFAWLCNDKVVLTVDDCRHCGKISMKGNTGDTGAGAVVRNGYLNSTFNGYNITLEQAPNADDTYTVMPEGGVISCSGNLNLKNCVVQNGNSKKGGNIILAYKAQAVLENCTIRNGVATGSGGNILVTAVTTSTGTDVTMTDCTVTGGTATGNGGGIYFDNNGKTKLTLSGKTVISDNTVSNLMVSGYSGIALDKLAEGSEIGLTGCGVVGETAASYVNYFKADDTRCRVTTKGEALVLEITPTHKVEQHCVCGGLGTIGDHTACTDVTAWTPLTSDCFTSSVTKGRIAFKETTGFYYVPEGGYALTAALEILPDQNITICLNGEKLSCFAGERLRVYGTLTLTDCSMEKNGEVYSTANYASVFYAFDGAVINQFGGILKSSGEAKLYGSIGTLAADKYSLTGYTPKNNGDDGSAVYNLYGGAMDAGGSGTTGNTMDLGGAVCVWKSSVFNMYGGVITGGKANGRGGNLFVTKNAVLNIYGGTVSDGTAKNGGNIYCLGVLNMSGGKVSGGTTNVALSGTGGNIYVAADAVANISGGLVEGGITDKAMGGNIMNEGTLNISGEAVISGGSTKGGNSGGNIANNGTVSVIGGTVSGGYASEGGNLYNASGAKSMTLIDCTITGGTATVLGGGVRYKSGTLTLGGNVIIQDNSDKNGTSNLCIGNSKQITVAEDGMGAEANVGVNFGSTTANGTIGSIAAATGFTSDSNKLEVAVIGGVLTLRNKTLSSPLLLSLRNLLSVIF